MPVDPAVNAHTQVVKIKRHIGVELAFEKNKNIQQRTDETENPQGGFLTNGQIEVQQTQHCTGNFHPIFSNLIFHDNESFNLKKIRVKLQMR